MAEGGVDDQRGGCAHARRAKPQPKTDATRDLVGVVEHARHAPASARGGQRRGIGQ